jgi:hypothetical protein
MASLDKSPSPQNEKSPFEADVHHAPADSEIAPDDIIVNRYGVLGPLLAKLFASGVEARGVERVPESERESKNTWNKSVPSQASLTFVSLFESCLLFSFFFCSLKM